MQIWRIVLWCGVAACTTPPPRVFTVSTAATPVPPCGPTPVVAALAPPPEKCTSPTGGGCGLNGAWLGGNVPVHEADADTTKWTEQLRIVSFTKLATPTAPAVPLSLRVEADRLIGTTPAGAQLREGDLVGTQLEIQVIEDATRACYETRYLRITNYQPAPYWAAPQPGESVPLLEIRYLDRPDAVDTKSICEPVMDPREPFTALAVTFEGEQYDEEGYRVIDVSDSHRTRFQIACWGTTIAKLHMHRHTAAARVPALPDGKVGAATTLRQRTTLLKQLVGDFCDTGESWTVQGTPLWIQHAQPWTPTPPRGGRLEAYWGPTGAICLNRRRHPELGDLPCKMLACTQDQITKAEAGVPWLKGDTYGVSLLPR